MAHTVAKTSQQARERIKNKSPYGMPDSPTAQGWEAGEIKDAFWRFILDNSNSIMAEIDRICDEATAMTAGTANIDDAAVTSAKIAAAAIITSLLADGAVTTAKITDANVTADKLASNAVTTDKIADANVTTAKVADGNITTAKIADANVTTAKVADGAITDAKITSVANNKVTGLSAAIATMLAGLMVTTAPTGDNTAGYYKFAHLSSEPETKYNGWIYLIDEE